MGLDLRYGNQSMRVGSYSGVHDRRIALIRGLIDYIKEFHKDRDTDYLEALIDPDASGGIVYAHVDSIIDTLSEHKRADRSLLTISYGVYKFVDHSDCDGYHTPGDCLDIGYSISALQPYLLGSRLSVTSAAMFWSDLATFFKAAATRQRVMRYT